MSEIKKSSLNYKMISLFFEPSYNLCVYFWQGVLSILLMIIMGFISLFMFVVLVVSPILAVALFVYSPFAEYMDSLPNDHLLASLVAVGFILILAGIIFGLFNGARRLTKCIKHRWGNGVASAPRQPSLVSEYFRAKKEKICPTITFLEDE